MTQTTGSFLSFSLYFLTLFRLSSALSLSLSVWGVAKVANRHSHSVVYVRIYCVLNICLRSTWSEFQTPATSPQLNFTLFKHHSQCCLGDVANLSSEPHRRLRCVWVYLSCICVWFLEVRHVGNLMGKKHNATLRRSSATFQNSCAVQNVRELYIFGTLWFWQGGRVVQELKMRVESTGSGPTTGREAYLQDKMCANHWCVHICRRHTYHPLTVLQNVLFHPPC